MEPQQTSATETDIEAWRRKLVFRSWHRGTREMDLLLGRFAEAEVKDFSTDELTLYEALLSENDPDLYGWISGAAPAPFTNAVVEKLLRFHAKARA